MCFSDAADVGSGGVRSSNERMQIATTRARTQSPSAHFVEKGTHARTCAVSMCPNSLEKVSGKQWLVPEASLPPKPHTGNFWSLSYCATIDPAAREREHTTAARRNERHSWDKERAEFRPMVQGE